MITKPLDVIETQPLAVRGFTDELMDRYYELSFQTGIEDSKAHGTEWAELSYDFDKNGRPSMAAMCVSRAQYWGVQPLGAYVRELAGSFSELIPATVCEHPEQPFIEEGYVCCSSCGERLYEVSHG
jgi:hypothetical protein